MGKERKITILTISLFIGVMMFAIFFAHVYMNGEFPMWNSYKWCGVPTLTDVGHGDWLYAFNFFFFIPAGWIVGSFAFIILMTREILILHYEEVIKENKYLKRRLKNKK